ncbi:MAG: hypothetical protein AAGA58_03990 [Verrucomicrobiota bacterium]
MSNWLNALILRLAVCTVAAALVAEAHAGGRKNKTFLSFHIEAESVEEGKMVERIRLGNKEYFFRKAPEITDTHVDTFYPFPSANGRSYGVAFKLDKVGQQRLAVITEASLDKRLLTAVNLNPINFVVIDSPIRDGVIVVWSGLTAEHIAKFDKEFQRGEMDQGGATGETPAEAGTEIVSPEEEKKPRKKLFGRRNRFSKEAREAAPELDDWMQSDAPAVQ